MLNKTLSGKHGAIHSFHRVVATKKKEVRVLAVRGVSLLLRGRQA